MAAKAPLYPTARPRWTVQDRLRKAREHAGLTSTELADRLGVHRNSVVNWENGGGKRGVPRTVILAYSAETGIDPDWIEHGDDPARVGLGAIGWMLPTALDRSQEAA